MWAAKLEIAVDLTRILGEIHQQDCIHLDLNSKNILIGNKQGAVHLIDLGDDQDGKSGGGFSGRGIAFLNKPVHPEELSAHVKTHVELFRARK